MKQILILLCALLGLGSCQGGNSTQIDNRTVAQFDVSRFMGKWYEIARYDHRFEKGMSRVTATYTLLPNGRIEVLNAGYKDGKYKEITGKDYVDASTSTSAGASESDNADTRQA